MRAKLMVYTVHNFRETNKTVAFKKFPKVTKCFTIKDVNIKYHRGRKVTNNNRAETGIQCVGWLLTN